MKLLYFLFVMFLGSPANATVLVPTEVVNDTPIDVRIIVTRRVRCFGPDKGKAGPWVSSMVLAASQRGRLPLMAGSHNLCQSAVDRMTIEASPSTGANFSGPLVQSLLLTEHFPDYSQVLHVGIDPQSRRFVLKSAVHAH